MLTSRSDSADAPEGRRPLDGQGERIGNERPDAGPEQTQRPEGGLTAGATAKGRYSRLVAEPQIPRNSYFRCRGKRAREASSPRTVRATRSTIFGHALPRTLRARSPLLRSLLACARPRFTSAQDDRTSAGFLSTSLTSSNAGPSGRRRSDSHA